MFSNKDGRAFDRWMSRAFCLRHKTAARLLIFMGKNLKVLLFFFITLIFMIATFIFGGLFINKDYKPADTNL